MTFDIPTPQRLGSVVVDGHCFVLDRWYTWGAKGPDGVIDVAFGDEERDDCGRVLYEANWICALAQDDRATYDGAGLSAEEVIMFPERARGAIMQAALASGLFADTGRRVNLPAGEAPIWRYTGVPQCLDRPEPSGDPEF